MREDLPIDAYLERVVASVSERRALVLVAEPGAGKTTRVPVALCSSNGLVICVQPRRLAARNAALRVCDELGERVGGRIGYAVRFDTKRSSRTRVLYVTTGVFLRMLAAGEGLGGADTVVLDEFHERSLDIDLALCACIARRRVNVDTAPRLVVMSATLDAERLASFIDGPIVSVPGRLHSVDVEYLPPRPRERGDDHIARACRNLLVRANQVNKRARMLVFVPGRAEMRAARRALERLREGQGRQAFSFEIAELFGSQQFAEQKRVLRPPSPESPSQVILATRVAETSLTVPELNAVVDTGLSRRARVDPVSGFSTLETRSSTLASLEQRAGRAGRTGPGTCVRLFDERLLATLPKYDAPEIETADCAAPMLLLSSLGIDNPPFLDPPPHLRWQAAKTRLELLGAVDQEGHVTDRGLQMAALPVHPRIAAMLTEARARAVSFRASMLAALLEEQDLGSSVTDIWAVVNWLAEKEGARRGEVVGLDAGVLRSVFRAASRLRALTRADEEAATRFVDDKEALAACLLSGYADRLGRLEGQRIKLVDGSSFELPSGLAAHGSFAVVLSASGPLGRQTVRTLASVSEDTVLEMFLERLEERIEYSYDPEADRVLEKRMVMLGAMSLEEQEVWAASGEATTQKLREVIARNGLGTVMDVDAFRSLKNRLGLIAMPTARIEEQLEQAISNACEGASSLADVRKNDPLALLRYGLAPEAVRLLEARAPLTIDLPGRRGVQVHYEADRPPWAASYLQEFFGLRDAPQIGQGPLTLHLWAPNGRAVQVTNDLAGFWERQYPSLRKELSRRYPKHHWPEDPRSAKPVRLKRFL